MKLKFSRVMLLLSILIAGCAAYFSVWGLSQLFAGASLSVIIMASILETGKVVTTTALHKYWDYIGKPLRIYLTISVGVLMIITSAGIYGFLSNAYQITSNKLNIHEGQITILSNKKHTFENKVTENQKVIDSKTKRVDQLSDLRTNQETRLDNSTSNRNRNSVRGDINSANGEIQILNKDIETLMTKNSVLSDSIGVYDIKILDLRANSNVAGEVGPLKYISALTGVPMDNVVNYLILLLIFVFDPLAIALVILTNKAFDIEKMLGLEALIVNKPEPIVEEPIIEEPIVKEIIIEESITEEPIIEEPIMEKMSKRMVVDLIVDLILQSTKKPKVQQSIIEKEPEPIICEPIIEDSIIEEPIIEELIIEEVLEPIAEELITEEVVIEEVIVEEPIIEEPTIIKPTIEELIWESIIEESMDEAFDEELIIEEPVIEEVIIEEVIVEEPIEEVIVEEVIIEEPVVEELIEESVVEELIEEEPIIEKQPEQIVEEKLEILPEPEQLIQINQPKITINPEEIKEIVQNRGFSVNIPNSKGSNMIGPIGGTNNPSDNGLDNGKFIYRRTL